MYKKVTFLAPLNQYWVLIGKEKAATSTKDMQWFDCGDGKAVGVPTRNIIEIDDSRKVNRHRPICVKRT